MVSTNLKKIRKRKRLTQGQFAIIIGVSQNYLSEIENNKKCPSLKKLEEIATKLNIPMSKIISN